VYEKPVPVSGLGTLLSMLALPVLIGPGILLWQIYNWLRTAQWRPVPVSDAPAFFEIPYPHFDWLGFQKIADAVLDWPLSIVAFAAWMAAIVFTMAFIEEMAKKKNDKQFGR
jgi:hypothetical protein